MVRLSDERRRFTCCFCLHVRTGTILFGVAQILLHLICISVLVLLAIRPDLIPPSGLSVDKQHNFALTNGQSYGGGSHAFAIILHLVPGISDFQDSVALPPPHNVGKNDPSVLTDESERISGDDKNLELAEKPDSVRDSHTVHVIYGKRDEQSVTVRHRRHFSPYFALCLSSFSLAFCCFLVHGAVARQPTHLLPFFFLQVFDFIISLLTVVGYMSSTSDVRLWLHTKEGPMYINSASLTFLLLSISFLVLAFKAYCLGMVWDCYKYLMLAYNRPDRADDWIGNRFGFLPSIWSFFGAGRRSGLMRGGNLRASEQHGAFGSRSDAEGGSRPSPAVYDQSNDLPNYEDALKIPANAYAPPPYFAPVNNNNNKTQSSNDGLVLDAVAQNTGNVVDNKNGNGIDGSGQATA